MFSSCGKNGGRGCGGGSESSQTREVEGAKLFVRNVWEASGEQLEKAFGQFGNVTDTYNPGRGFVFVTFYSAAGAQVALYAMNCSGTILMSRLPSREPFNCIFSNFHLSIL